MKTKIIFLLILLAFFSLSTSAQKQSSAEFVKSFYDFHRSLPNNTFAEDIEAHKKWFTNELYKLFQYELKREEEFLKENPIFKPHYGDGLPFVPLEECYFKGKWIKNVLKIGKTSIKGNKTLIEVRFYQPKVCEGYFIHAYKFELVKNKGSWLINDFIFLVDNSRLTNDLKREKY